ncbi:endonuclease/exonuclease/phosphatase family protein [Medicago truncatula]|uniref:Endonuclease/exonuclease/phosphatase family protein n=1 Tax=Medicago truncatula TaxID=3880 RepID=A0A072VTZ0_MEDTR|nr:endonuclease/exonuclease/phosphatase family protein [Medicago truncatula]
MMPVLEKVVSPVAHDDVQPVEVGDSHQTAQEELESPALTNVTTPLLDSPEHNLRYPRELGGSPKGPTERVTNSSPLGREDIRPNEEVQLTQTSREELENPKIDDFSKSLQDGVEQDHVSLRELEKSSKGARENVPRPSLDDPVEMPVLSVEEHARPFDHPADSVPHATVAIATTLPEPVVAATSNVAADGIPVEEAEAGATKEDLLPVLTQSKKQKLKVQQVLATQPPKPRSRGNNHFAQIPSWYWPSIGVTKYCINDRGSSIPNLWALWGNYVIATVIFISDQCIALEISCFNSTVYLAAIYAHNYYVKRRELWADLTNLQGCFQGPWLFVGDFNCILGAHEKRGRRPPPPLSCEDFLNWTNANVLNHLPTLGSFFTWSNGRFGMENFALRLDKAVCNEAWVNFWRQSTCSALVRPFKFFKVWTSHVDCRQLVTEVWSKEVRGRGMLRLQAKLRNIKNSFKAWTCNVFGDVDRQVRLAVDEVNRIQILIDIEGFSDTLYLQDLEAQMLLTNALNVQEQFWKEKARNQHFINGDRNTAYFHRVSKIRATTNSIS